MLLFASCLHH